TTPVISFIDDRTELVLLGKVIPIEALVAGLGCIWQIDVSELAARELVDKPAIRFNPGARSQALLVRDRYDRDLASAFHRETVIDREHNLAVRRSVEKTIYAVRRLQLFSVDGEHVIADG